jgi:hypothetical protein
MERRFGDAIGANSPLRQRRRGDPIAALFVAVHEFGSGTSRHFAARPNLVAVGAKPTSIKRINQARIVSTHPK